MLENWSYISPSNCETGRSSSEDRLCRHQTRAVGYIDRVLPCMPRIKDAAADHQQPRVIATGVEHTCLVKRVCVGQQQHRLHGATS